MHGLVIGADGFAGRWLLRHMTDCGDSVDAIVGPHFEAPLVGAERVERIDVLDATTLAGFVAETQPEAIYYLAGISQRGDRDRLEAAAGVSVVGCLNALMAASAVPRPPRILYPSTGYVYLGGEGPLSEDAPTSPAGIYAAGKLAAEDALRRLAPLAGVEVIVARAFNHIGPGQSEAFLIPSVARQIASAAAGATDIVRIGSSAQVRDFCDVRDVVRAYRLLVTRGRSDTVYNVASGTGISIAQLVQMMIEISGIAAHIESSPSVEGDEQPQTLIGDATRLRTIGWRLDYGLRHTLADVLAEHLQNVSGS